MPKFLSAVTVPSAVSGYVPFAPYGALPAAITASSIDVFTGAVGAAATVRRWHQWVLVGTPNNVSKYRSIVLMTLSGATIATVNTNGTGTTWQLLSATNLAYALGTTTFCLIRATKVGALGGLWLATPAVYVE